MSTEKSIRRVANPPNPWQASELEFDGMPPPTALKVFEDHSRQILSKNASPDLPFRFSLNPYRGCYHGCAYCYARPSHHYLDLGAGTDFERSIVIKPQAAELLRQAFDRPSWSGDAILFSGNTDCYQPLELSYGLTRACLEICRDYRNPVTIITKSTLIERDIDLLRDLDARAACTVTVSLPFMDPGMSRAIEPYVPSPRRRLKTIRRLSDAGLNVRVSIAPVIPGLADAQIPQILEAAHDAGARAASFVLLRLSPVVSEVFEARLRDALPERADRVMNQLRACRNGETYDHRFGRRLGGVGARYEAIEALFVSTARRLGMLSKEDPLETDTFTRPHEGRQIALL
uniref:DNA repair photolyase n=2 Tax=environmental samples TaxID=48479 RepID=C7FPG2_9BACT|nr:DNA repair photolyase [uncultured bacterium HF186_25m_30B18]ACU26465.1 DNA repair photolyase [uncultured bacterium HF186_25m_13D19]